jgi:D-alanyl-lipoteichoic acid acyltransferase DltB (MBOAT superfamily)
MFRGKQGQPDSGWTVFYPFQALVTFALVMIGWVFFRAVNLHDSVYVLRQMFSGGAGAALMPVWLMALAFVTLLLALLEEKKQWFEKIALGPAWAYGLVCAFLLLCVEMIGFSETPLPFVYFQF